MFAENERKQLFNLDQYQRIYCTDGLAYTICAANGLDTKPVIMAEYSTNWQRDQVFRALSDALREGARFFDFQGNLGKELPKIYDGKVKRRGGS